MIPLLRQPTNHRILMSTPSALAMIGASAILAGLQLVASNPSYSQESPRRMSQRELKELLRFSTTQNCLPRLNDRPLFTDLRRAGNAFGLILTQNHNGNIAGVSNTLDFEKARAFFANELGFQVLKTCPNILTPNEKSRIEKLKLELQRQ